MMRRAQGDRAFFPESERRDIEDLACATPAGVGRELTPWSQRSLAQAATEFGYVESIHQTTVGDILREARLHPQRFRYWKKTVWDDLAIERALKILWDYARIDSLWQRGEIILCLDEKPNIQVLERAKPTQLMRPGQVEHQEFD